MTTVYVYLRPLPGARPAFRDGVAARPDAKAAESYLASMGVDSPRWVNETDLVRPKPFAHRTAAKVLLSQLREGDIAIFPEFSCAFDYPSDALAVVQGCLGRGHDLRILDLSSQSGATLLPLLRATAAAFRPLEDALKAAQTELGAVQARAEKRLDLALRDGLAQMAQSWGLPKALLVNPQLGDVREALPEVAHRGTIVAAKRKALGISQRELAEQLNLTQGTIGKIEAGIPGIAEATVARVWHHLFDPPDTTFTGDKHAT